MGLPTPTTIVDPFGLRRCNMTEQEWLDCPDWREMFTFLEGRLSDRKLRLFAVACWRLAWPQLPGEGKNAVEFAEKFADGYASIQELQAIRETFLAGTGEHNVEVIRGQRFRCVFGSSAADADALWAAKAALRQSADAVTLPVLQMTGQSVTSATVSSMLSAEMAVRRQLLHDVVGPLFFRSVICEPTWLTSDVTALAMGVYQEKAFDRLPILGDALKEAGCMILPSSLIFATSTPMFVAVGCLTKFWERSSWADKGSAFLARKLGKGG